MPQTMKLKKKYRQGGGQYKPEGKSDYMGSSNGVYASRTGNRRGRGDATKHERDARNRKRRDYERAQRPKWLSKAEYYRKS